MATIQTLVERIEKRLFLLSGLDVQIHAEDQIVEMLRGVYNNLFDDFWDQDLLLYQSFDLNGTTGEIVGDLSETVLRYKDIHSVYLDECETPLPKVTPGSNVSELRREAIMPSGDPVTVFKVVPSDTVGTVGVWYRTRIADDVWDNQDFEQSIPMDDELLLLGVVYEFLVNDDSNQQAAKMYAGKFVERKSQITKAQFQVPITKKKLDRDRVPADWR